MEVNLVSEGLKVMILGMTTVFLFLILMVFVLNIQAKLLNKYFPEKKKAPASAKTPAKTQTQDDSEVVAAIIGAITEFRKK